MRRGPRAPIARRGCWRLCAAGSPQKAAAAAARRHLRYGPRAASRDAKKDRETPGDPCIKARHVAPMTAKDAGHWRTCATRWHRGRTNDLKEKAPDQKRTGLPAMRVSDTILNTVVFLGYPSSAPGKGGIECIGTGFLLLYDGAAYLVTARHVAEHFGSDPFLIRVNRYDRTGHNIHVDQTQWYFDVDPTVDVAITPFDLRGDDSPYVARYIDDARETWWWNKARKYGAGIGDFVYTVGLFRLLAGNARNMPVVHFGIIARTMDWIETVPIKDWRDPTGIGTIQTNAYLVESQSLSGLSGAPVFIRASNLMVSPETIQQNPGAPIEDIGDAVAMWKLHLLGVWQGAWDAPPDHVLGLDHGREVRVPVGMGAVVPADYIHAILEQEALKTERANRKQQR
jgi:hypothetical protein